MPDQARLQEEQATQRRARILGLEYVDSSEISNKQIFKILKTDEIEQLRIVPLNANAQTIKFGITNNTSRQTMDSLRARFTDQQISFAMISDSSFKEYLAVYNPPKEVKYEDVSLGGQQEERVKSITQTLAQVRSDDILAYLVKQTYQLKGSDIHLECQKQDIRVRIRVDGVLHEVARIDHEKYRALLSSVAVAANISTGSDSAQTGHINKSYRMSTGEDVTVNLRVETIPVVYGQDVVMRMFNFDIELCKLENLGLNEQERAVVDDIIKHPNGMVLIVGPTGSGKTTTLYSLINTLNNEERKIITLEDPVEYYIPGIVQVPVKGDQDKTGFGEKLRAAMRLDPDVMMIGEIRDQDTARTCLQAALTGHLVLSTFHANSAAAALTRMMDAIGINPLFASAIRLVMSQRLVRRLDDATKEQYDPDPQVQEHIKTILKTLPEGTAKPDLNQIKLYKAVPSAEHPFGFNGQLAIREQLPMSSEVQKILRLPPNQVTTEMIQNQAAKDGMVTMLQDGMLKALAGQTTIEEVYRVVS